MHFCYRACTIDATPEFSLGRYFAHAKIERSQDISEGMGCDTYDSGDLGDFDSEADAVAFAHSWAIEWIETQLGPGIRRTDSN